MGRKQDGLKINRAEFMHPIEVQQVMLSNQHHLKQLFAALEKEKSDAIRSEDRSKAQERT